MLVELADRYGNLITRSGSGPWFIADPKPLTAREELINTMTWGAFGLGLGVGVLAAAFAALAVLITWPQLRPWQWVAGLAPWSLIVLLFTALLARIA
ncbi:MAG: hypothetical protein WBC44_22195 [Planctomycetaceae bacterium]